MESINSKIITAKTKLSDRNMVWKEAYTSRTLFLKKQFHDVLGPGSYFRFEGHDTDSGDEYFVVVGPAKVHQPKAEFFAGVRKLPADFSAGGLYFHDLKEAMEYAVDTWGVSSPSEMDYYDSSDLKGISKKVKEWKKEQDEETNSEGYLQEWYKSIKKEGKTMPVNDQEYFYVESNTFPFFTKEAMAARHKKTNATWYDIDDLIFGTNDQFNEQAARRPSLNKAAAEAAKIKLNYKDKIAKAYGERFATDNANFYQIWLAITDVNMYIVSVGPYYGTPEYSGELSVLAQDRFGAFQRKLNLTTLAEITNEIERQKDEYAEKYNIVLRQEDFNSSFAKSPEEKQDLISGTFKLGEITMKAKAGRQFLSNPAWRQMLVDYYGVDPDDPNAKNQAKAKQLKINKKRDADLRKAYEISVENGEAFERQQPPPPSLGPWERYRHGQQVATTIQKQNRGLAENVDESGQVDQEDVDSINSAEKIDQLGFGSIQEAATYLTTQTFPGAPIANVPSTTSEDLKAARLARIAELELDNPEEQNEIIMDEPIETTEIEPNVEEPEIEIPVPVKQTKKPVKKLAPEPAPVVSDDSDLDYDFSDIGFIANSSLFKMIKIAEELDAKGKYKEAKEMHKILKKHIL